MLSRSLVLLAAALAVALLGSGCARPGAGARGGDTAAQPGAPAADTAAQPGVPAADTAAQPGDTTATAGSRYVVDPARSTASYRVQEKFVNRDLPNLAVGTTSEISGELVLTDAGLAPSVVTVDLRTLQSDSPRRDSALRRRFLESDRHPMAEFRIEGAAGGAAAFAEGIESRFQLTGTMQLHGVERPVTWEATGSRDGNALVLRAVTAFKLTDFSIQVPDIAGMLKADDRAEVQVTLTAAPAAG